MTSHYACFTKYFGEPQDDICALNLYPSLKVYEIILLHSLVHKKDVFLHRAKFSDFEKMYKYFN